MPTLIAIWNCAMTPGWRAKALNARITALQAPAFTASAEAKMKRADATGAGTLPGQVNRHVIVGQGVGHAVIANKALDYQIVAEAGNYSVTRLV